MIIRRTSTDPESRSGFQCVGAATSANTGIISISVKGKDYSSKISGLVLTPIHDSATTLAFVQITSIAYSSATQLTTILGRVFVSDDISSPAFSLTDSVVVNYSFWVDERSLPTDLTTNNTFKQDY